MDYYRTLGTLIVLLIGCIVLAGAAGTAGAVNGVHTSYPPGMQPLVAGGSGSGGGAVNPVARGGPAIGEQASTLTNPIAYGGPQIGGGQFIRGQPTGGQMATGGTGTGPSTGGGSAVPFNPNLVPASPSTGEGSGTGLGTGNIPGSPGTGGGAPNPIGQGLPFGVDQRPPLYVTRGSDGPVVN